MRHNIDATDLACVLAGYLAAVNVTLKLVKLLFHINIIGTQTGDIPSLPIRKR